MPKRKKRKPLEHEKMRQHAATLQDVADKIRAKAEKLTEDINLLEKFAREYSIKGDECEAYYLRDLKIGDRGRR